MNQSLSCSSLTTYINLLDIKEFKDIIGDENIDSNSNLLKHLIVNKVEYNNKLYKIVKYDKTILKKDLIPSYGLFRSVIMTDDNEILSYAPPKSIDAEVFLTKYPDVTDKNIVAMEFIDGTMIQLFWDVYSSVWEITTRNIIGANTTFYLQDLSCNNDFPSIKPIQLTFREMFFEAVKDTKLVIEELDKDKCYSFVLQHPNNRIVVPVKTPQLYLVGIYSVKKYIVHSYNIKAIKGVISD